MAEIPPTGLYIHQAHILNDSVVSQGIYDVLIILTHW